MPIKNKMLLILALILVISLMVLVDPQNAYAAELPEEHEEEPYDWYEYETQDEDFIELPDEYYQNYEPVFEDGPNPFAPDGTGTVVNNATDDDGKEFYTIETPDGNVFFLVIDRQRSTDNVYFLGAVTEEDLMSLAQIEKAPENAADVPLSESIETDGIMPEEAPKPESSPASEGTQNNEDMMLYVIVGAAVIGIGGIGYYFKVVRPKREGTDDDDYGEDYGDDEDDNSFDSEDKDEQEENGYSDENEYEDENNMDFDNSAAPATADGYNNNGNAGQHHNPGTAPPYTGNRNVRRRKKRRKPQYNG